MLEKIPSQKEINALTGASLGRVWEELCAAIDEQYEMEHVWNHGGKAWDDEYKYRRGGKALCCRQEKPYSPADVPCVIAA